MELSLCVQCVFGTPAAQGSSSIGVTVASQLNVDAQLVVEPAVAASFADRSETELLQRFPAIHATMRSGPPLPPLIFIGSAIT